MHARLARRGAAVAHGRDDPIAGSARSAVTARFGGSAPTSAISMVAPSGTDARSPASQPLSCRSVTTTIVPRRPPSAAARGRQRAAIARRAESRRRLRRSPPSPARDRSDGCRHRLRASANVTTPTRSPDGARLMASFASCLARANRARRRHAVRRVERHDRHAGRAARRRRTPGTAGRTPAPAAPAPPRAAPAAAAREAAAGRCTRPAPARSSLTAANFTRGFRLALAAGAARSARPPPARRPETAATETSARPTASCDRVDRYDSSAISSGSAGVRRS